MLKQGHPVIEKFSIQNPRVVWHFCGVSQNNANHSESIQECISVLDQTFTRTKMHDSAYARARTTQWTCSPFFGYCRIILAGARNNRNRNGAVESCTKFLYLAIYSRNTNSFESPST
jgi:hypothetical protein